RRSLRSWVGSRTTFSSRLTRNLPFHGTPLRKQSIELTGELPEPQLRPPARAFRLVECVPCPPFLDNGLLEIETIGASFTDLCLEDAYALLRNGELQLRDLTPGGGLTGIPGRAPDAQLDLITLALHGNVGLHDPAARERHGR